MTPARLLVNVASPFPCPSYVTFPTMAIAAPPMAPVPEFTYVPLRVAWEHCGGGTCDLTAEVVRNTVTIAPSVAKPFAVRLAFFIPISIALWDPKSFVMIVVPPAPYPGTGGKEGHRRRFYLW